MNECDYRNLDGYRHLIRVAREAKFSGREVLNMMSTGEKVAVALVLNRSDWLVEYGYTLGQAIYRSGSDSAGGVVLIPKVERDLADKDVE